MYYFGYGSNMLTNRLRGRVRSATPVTTARLDNYALRFHKRSRDGSGKCNIIPKDDQTVHGVVFDVASSGLDALDEAEQRGRGYRRQTLTVRDDSSTFEVFAYVAQSAYVDDALLPYDWYRALVLAGAREHRLAQSYVAKIESIRSYPDPSEERRRTHQTLLSEAGFSLLQH